MIYIDPNLSIPIYIQLYEAIKEDILDGTYSCGSYLPPIRKLASTLCVSKNTVDNAYQQLAVEGYIKSRPGAGHIVLDAGNAAGSYRHTKPFQQEKTINPVIASDENNIKIDFRYGDLSPEFFPNDYWRKAASHIFSSVESIKMSGYDDARGDECLRKAISSYVREHRGISSTPDQIIICSGFAHSINIACDLIEKDCHCIGMEDPGFYSARDMFRYKGFSFFPLHHYPENTYFDDLAVSGADCLYVTPSHQFPMGGVMPVDVRYRLLNWASEGNRYIIEDDYDSQLRYHSRPVPSLYSLCTDDRVIYIGTFSKSLSPAIRISYLVLPRRLADRYNALPQYRQSYVSWLDQRILAKYIEDGAFAKHLRKMNTICCTRHDLMRALLIEKFGDRIKIFGMNAGLHMVLKLNDNVSNSKRIRLAQDAGVAVYSIDDCFADLKTAPDNLILIGFGKVTEDQIRHGLTRLEKVWNLSCV